MLLKFLNRIKTKKIYIALIHIPVKNFLRMNMLKSHGHLNKPLDIGKEKIKIGHQNDINVTYVICTGNHWY